MNPSSWQAYLLIRKSRYKKKKDVYKTLMALSFDLTTTIYSVIVGGYVFASIFIFNDFFHMFQEQFQFIETQLIERFWLILTIVPMRYIFQSFRNPGIILTSSEYQLGMLPYSIRQIALFSMLEKWIKLLLKYTVVIIITILVTPIDAKLIILYFILFWMIEIFMTLPQWKLFQAHFMVKFAFFISLSIFAAIGTITQSSPMVGIIVLSAILISNILLIKRMFVHINWGRVVEVNDYLIWSMPLVSRATKVKFKRQRRFSIFQNMASRKKPFTYTNAAIHKRLWLQSYQENMEYIVKVVGGLLLTNIILPFINPVVALIGIAVTIFVYTTFVSSLFSDRFYTGIVQILPWDVDGFRNTTRRWTVIGFILIMIPMTIYSIIHFAWWSIGFILLLIGVYMLNYEARMDNATEQLNKRVGQATARSIVAFFGLGFIILCEFSPYFSLVSIAYLIYGFGKMNILWSKKHAG